MSYINENVISNEPKPTPNGDWLNLQNIPIYSSLGTNMYVFPHPQNPCHHCYLLPFEFRKFRTLFPNNDNRAIKENSSRISH